MIILIPAYEPDFKLIALLESIKAADPSIRTLVVDDGSGPHYQRIFDAAAALGSEVLTYPENHGKGFALKLGFAHIAQFYPDQNVVCADCDGQHSMVDILRVAEKIELKSTVMVLGQRTFNGHVPARSRFGNTISRWMFRLATGQRIHDTQTGLRGYPSSMLTWLQSVPGARYEYELNLLLRASDAGQQIESVEISTIYLEENASSHFRPLADSARIYAPMLKFCASGFAAFAIDTVALLVLTVLTDSLLIAVVAARALSSGVNFLVNRRVVFEHGRNKAVRTTASGYFALVTVLLAINYGLLAGLSALGLFLLPAKMLTEVTLLGISYAVQRRFLFNSKSTGATEALPPVKNPSHTAAGRT